MVKLIDRDARRSRLLFTLLTVFVFGIGSIIPTFSHKPEIIHRAEDIKPGYESSPETYTITASPHKIWADYMANGGWLFVVLGFIVAAGGIYWYITYTNIGDRIGNWVPMFGFWIIGGLLIFISYSIKFSSVQYSTTLTPKQYEVVKDNPDQIFPTK